MTMCQKRSGSERSRMSTMALMNAPTSATMLAMRMYGRSAAVPNRRSSPASSSAPAAIPPMKKYVMIGQPNAGEAVKNVAGRSVCTRRILPGRASDLAHAIRPQRQRADKGHHDRTESRQQRAAPEIARRHLRLARQPVYFRLVDEQEEGVEAAEWAVWIGAIEMRARLALLAELHDSRGRALAQHRNRAELNRVRGTCLGARRLQSDTDAIVAERAFLRRVGHVIDVDHAERARTNAVAAAVARIGLDDDSVELRADDRARGTHLETRRLHAMLAHIAHHEPAPLVRLGKLFDELHVPPRVATQSQRIVVALAAHLEVRAAVAARGKLIPLLARHLACLAPDADARVGEEAHRLL